MKRIYKIIPFAFLVLASCHVQRPATMVVPLSFTSTQPLGDHVTKLPPTPVFILPVNDQREDKTRIGENRDGTPTVPVYSDGPSVPDFFQAAVSQELRELGLNVVTNPNDATRVLSITLINFWVQESPGYVGSISATVDVRDISGKLLWSHTVIGSATNWGRSLHAENYRETIGDAIVDLVRNLDNDEGFQNTVVPNAMPSTATAP